MINDNKNLRYCLDDLHIYIMCHVDTYHPNYINIPHTLNKMLHCVISETEERYVPVPRGQIESHPCLDDGHGRGSKFTRFLAEHPSTST